jgi:hypothetical protein
MKQHKRILWILIICLAVTVLIQSIALIRCEMLTNRYHSDFEFAYKNNAMLGEMESFKVLECDGQTAQVYYVAEGKTDAHALTFEKVDGNWMETGWRCIWSATGSASEAVWPYWWHVIYGGI